MLYVAITNHGFGHATRMASVLAAVRRRCPDLPLAIATRAPRWLLEAYLPGDFVYRPQVLDVGVVQADSLRMDRGATLERWREIRDREAALMAEEVAFIHDHQVKLVLGDIPPLAAPIARRAGVPGWMVSNFGWDFIYRNWIERGELKGPEEEGFRELCGWIEDCFSQCDRLFRLPFHEAMAAFPVVEDVGLTGGSPGFGEAELRDRFAIATPPERTVLLTFGGLGLQQIPYQNLERFPDWTFISFDIQAPKLENLRIVDHPRYRPVDFMPLCDRLVSKPGYSTFAEACRQHRGILTLTRADFAEAQCLIDGIQSLVPHRILAPATFFEGDWEFLREPLQPPRSRETVAPISANPHTDGNEAIAQAILEQIALER